MIGVGFDINSIDEAILNEIDIINIENPLYSNYFNTDFSTDIELLSDKKYNKIIITDGAYIDLNPGASELEVINLVKRKIIQSIDFAREIKSTEIIFLSTFLPMIELEFYNSGFVNNSVAFWKDILREKNDIRISLCNTFEYTPEYLIEIVEKVNYFNFGLAFDIGHALAYGKIPLDNFYGLVEPFCKSIYIHSNNGGHDEHLNLFEGKLLKSSNFANISAKIKNKNVIIKTFDKDRLAENIYTLNSLFNKHSD